MTFKKFAINELDTFNIHDFYYVKDVVVAKSPRAESRKYSISGSVIVDRIGAGLRRTVTARILLCTPEDMQFLETHRKREIRCQYYEDGQLVTVYGYIISDITRNTPIYLYEDMAKGIYYPNVDITIEET